MARTINDIQQSIITDLQTYFPKLSTSKVAEWRLWTYVVAAAIHAFEIILDLFRQEVDELTAKITPGTKLWYAEMCYRFQNGHTLVFDKNTAQFYYEQDDPDSRIVKVVAVNEVYKMISIRVAKTDGEGRIIPLDDSERRNLADYIDTIHTTGIPTTIVSTTAIRYVTTWRCTMIRRSPRVSCVSRSDRPSRRSRPRCHSMPYSMPSGS